MLFLLLIYSSFIFCEVALKIHDISASSVNKFPHNIDEDFSINLKHPEIKSHHLYAMIILHVNCPLTSESQKLYIYPGFTTKLDHRLKETLFHVMNFQTSSFNTNIVLRFYREASDCTFMVEYSAIGAEHIHVKMPSDLMLVYRTKIILFRPAKLKLSITAEDGHQGGLSIGKRGDIICRATDGFPFYPPYLTVEKEIATLKEPITSGNSVSMLVVAALKDHGTLVKCTSGSVVTSTHIRVFHHASSVEVLPQNQQWFRQGSKLECKSVGGGYPTPVVRWMVIGLNDSTRDYFSLSSSSQTVSTIQINTVAPNDTRWSLNCSSVNIIPPLDRGGPSVVVNITIGDNVAGSIMMSNYMWIMVLVSVIFIVIVVIVLVNVTSFVRRCRRSSTAADGVVQHASSPPPSQSAVAASQQYSMVPNTDLLDTKVPNKEQDFFV